MFEFALRRFYELLAALPQEGVIVRYFNQAGGLYGVINAGSATPMAERREIMRQLVVTASIPFNIIRMSFISLAMDKQHSHEEAVIMFEAAMEEFNYTKWETRPIPAESPGLV